MAKLTAHPNLYNCCLNILRRKGFELKLYTDDNSVTLDHLTWVGLKNGYSFIANNPIELLGLAFIDEQVPNDDGDNTRAYWKTGEEDIWDELTEKVIMGEPGFD